jgi:hypothetical protein
MTYCNICDQNLYNMNKIVAFFSKPWVFLILLAFVLFMPLLISQSFFAKWAPFGEGSAHLGDTFGGLTAPFVGVISSFLVFVAFKAQKEANEQQKEANEILKNQIRREDVKKTIQESFTKINYYFDTLEWQETKGSRAFQGIIHYIHNSLYKISRAEKGHSVVRDELPNATPAEAIEFLNSGLMRRHPEVKALFIITSFTSLHLKYLDKVILEFPNSNDSLRDYIKMSIEELRLFFANKLYLTNEMINYVRNTIHITHMFDLSLFCDMVLEINQWLNDKNID